MPATTLHVVCLLLAQAGRSDFEPPPKAPALRSAKAEKESEPRAPALRLGEPALNKPKATQAQAPEPKTVIQPSSRRPPISLEREEPEDDDSDELQPPSGPGFKPRSSPPARGAAPALRLDASDEDELESPPAHNHSRTARAEPPRATVQGSGESLTAAGWMLRRALNEAHDSPLPGEPLTLLAALDRASDRNSQMRVVKAYWLLSVGVAEYHYSVAEVDFLDSVPEHRAAHEQAALTAARAAADAHLRQAQLAAVATQHELADAAQVSSGNSPLPSDAPYVGNYRTSFKELFVSRKAPSGLQRIDRTLPQLRLLIESQAAAVTAAEKSLHALSQAHDSGDVSVLAVLEAFEKLRRQRREFLMTVRDYNYLIADYALAVVNPSANRSTIVATLIEVVPKTKSVLVSPRRDVLQAGAEEPLGQEEFDTPADVSAENGPAFRSPPRRGLAPIDPPSLQPGEFSAEE